MTLSISEQIEILMNHGSSLTLNWSEDTGCWLVDWISSGNRFRGVSRSLSVAMQQAATDARVHFGKPPPIHGIG